MIRQILKWTVWGIVILIILIWLLGGGIQRIISTARGFPSFSLSGFLHAAPSFLPARLPWQPNFTDLTITVPGVDQYGNPIGPSKLGSISPYSQQVTLIPGAANVQNATGQYIIITNTGTQDVSMNGWSLQSALTGIRAFIPEAASPLIVGRVNAVRPIVLQPGDSMTVSTGNSPVGVSFSENSCTGYLGTLQSFSPPLANSCTSPSVLMPNAASFGASCAQYVSTVGACVFPLNPPSNLSSSCVSQMQTALSYNGCVSIMQQAPDFSRHAWRVYLSEPKPLWMPHDTVRLLDGDERVVAVISY